MISLKSGLRLALTGLLAVVSGACAQPDAAPREDGAGANPTAPSEQGPALVVVVAVDQLRADLLTGYEDLFSGGFRRLLDGGAVFVNATHDHARTETAVGHATLATGVYPATHGIVGNEWFVEDGQGGLREVYCMEDPGEALLGFPRMEGRSPANIRARGLAQWLLDANPEAQVVSVSRKDRAAIGLASGAPGHVYWIVEAAGTFTTSEFYRETLPEWVARYNETRMAEIYSDSVWVSSVPPDVAWRSRPDTAVFEWDGIHTFFPHRAHAEVDATRPAVYNGWFTRTPGGDLAVAELARIALGELGLGRGRGPDFLAVSFSAVDYVGHRFGPGSREQLDNLLRLDAVLGEFMDGLDEAVGPGRWVLGLSADHGVMNAPESDPSLRRIDPRPRDEVLRAVASFAGANPGAHTLPPDLLASLEALDAYGGLTPYEVLRGTEPVDSITQLQRNGFFEGRHRDVLGVVGLEGYRPERSLVARTTVASHGSPWHYDRWVPLIFYGTGVEPGIHTERAATVDLAPTLAGLAGIRPPDGLDGRSLIGN